MVLFAEACIEISTSRPFDIDIWCKILIFVGCHKTQKHYIDERGRKYYSKEGEG